MSFRATLQYHGTSPYVEGGDNNDNEAIMNQPVQADRLSWIIVFSVDFEA